jgi:TonB family protein
MNTSLTEKTMRSPATSQVTSPIFTLALMLVLAAPLALSAAGRNPGLGPDDSGPLKVATEIQNLRLVEQVKPTYPELAKLSRTEGTVVLQILITKDGKVSKVEIVSGPPLLTRAAQDAVKNWKYKPTIVNGQEVEVSTQVKVQFNMH